MRLFRPNPMGVANAWRLRAETTLKSLMMISSAASNLHSMMLFPDETAMVMTRVPAVP